MYLGMIDYLSFSVDIFDYQKEHIKKLLSQLEHYKQQSSHTGLKEDAENATIDLSGVAFEVLGNGTRGYAYILHNDEYEIRMSKYRARNKAMYPLFIRIKQDALWGHTPMGAYKYILYWIQLTIGQIKAIKINRADLCCHTDVFKFDISDANRFRGQFRGVGTRSYNRKLTGLEFGERQSPIFLRIYNKTTEVVKKNKKLWFLKLWDDEGADITNVWNVEFELHRDFFKEIHLETVDDLFDRLKDIWLYLTTEWVQFVNIDNERFDRCSINEKWENLLLQFDGAGSQGCISRDRQTSIDSKTLIPQISGYMTKLGAMLKQDNIDDVFKLAVSQVNEYFENKGMTFKDRTNEKMELMGLKLVGD